MAFYQSYLLQNSSPESIRRHLGDRIARLRLTATRTQADVAKAAGISVPTLHRLENGGNATLDVLVRVAVALGAESGLAALFPLPDARTIDEIVAQPPLRKRGRSR